MLGEEPRSRVHPYMIYREWVNGPTLTPESTGSIFTTVIIVVTHSRCVLWWKAQEHGLRELLLTRGNLANFGSTEIYARLWCEAGTGGGTG